MAQLLSGLKDMKSKGFLENTILFDNIVIEIQRGGDGSRDRSPREIFANASSSGVNRLLKDGSGLMDIAAELLVHIIHYLPLFKTVESFRPSHVFRNDVESLDEIRLQSLLEIIASSAFPIGALTFPGFSKQ